jgi:glycosyltransferase involved in cell wall biosynthesis
VFVKKHAAAIKSSGVEIEIIAITVSPSAKLFEKKEYETIDENGIKTHNVELNSVFYKFIHVHLFWQYGILKKVYLQKVKPHFKPDIIHSNVLYPAAIMGDWLANREGLPHIITEHWSKVNDFMNKSFFSRYGLKAYNRAKKITVVSEFLGKNISGHLTDKEKIVRVPNVINTHVFNYEAKQSHPEKLVFTCTASWTAPKRPDLIFESLEKISHSIKRKITLNVIGRGPLLDELKNKKWTFSVNYHGNLDSSGIAAILHRSDFFLHASDMETFSIVTVEALATGTPVLTSQVGGLPELVNENNGLILQNRLEDWTQGIVKLTERNFDYEAISRSAQKFSVSEIGKAFREVYLSV